MRRRPALVAAAVLALILPALAGWAFHRSRPEPAELFAQAEQLRLAYERTTSQQALSKYRDAQASWRRKGNTREAARAAQRLGQTYDQLGSPQESLKAHLAALSLARESGDALLESEIRSEIGVAQSLAIDEEQGLEEAQQHCETALSIARHSNGPRQVAKALNCLGEVSYHHGNLERALAFYRQAEPISTSAGDQRGQAEALLFQGYVHSDLSQFGEAQACYERSLSLWTRLDDKRGKAITLVADARLRQRRGENQEALNRFLQALTLLEPMGDPIWEASSLTGVATIYLQMGDTARAVKYWERALERFEGAGLKNYSVDVLISVGATYLASGDDTAALDRFQRALAVANELGNQRWQSYALRYLGLVYLHRRQPQEARQHLERAMSVQKSLGDPRLDAQTRADIGEAHELLGDYRAAAQYFEGALGLSRAAADRTGEARALFGLGRASVGLEDLGTARRHIERSLEVAESLRTEVRNQDLRASYVASVHQYYEWHVNVLMRLHEQRPHGGLASQAFLASERARARSLLDSLTEAGVDLRAGVDPALIHREEALKRAFDDWAKRHRQLGEAADADVRTLAAEYRDLEERYAQIQAEIRSRSPRYAALAQPQPLSLEAVQAQLIDDETLLLEYALGDERSFLWAVSKTNHTSYVLPPRADIERATQRVYELLTARLTVTGTQQERRRRIEQADVQYWQEAARLSEMLLGPAAKTIAGRRILVVGDGALQYLPFAALPVPGRQTPVPLVAEHEIVSLPSASVLAVLRSEARSRKPAAGIVAVLADPVFEADDPRLSVVGGASGRTSSPAAQLTAVDAAPGASADAVGLGLLRGGGLEVPRLASTRQEANAIVAAALRGPTLRAMDFDASRATAMSPDLSNYRIVHFATHGVFDAERPDLTGIILSLFDRNGQAQNGLLRLHDIYGLHLPAELVVLSACSTALGKSLRGEGLVGIVRGFMYAGARRVVASHWMVDDEATGELMKRFYTEMLDQNRSPAAALRQAQLAVRQQARWQAPFFWAAFVLQGEWE